MIKSRVREVAESRGVNSSYELQNRIGLAPTVALRLWRDEVTRFSVQTLEKLCREFDCQPGDLLIYVREKKGGGRK
ncbi:MAG TPA: helix-turn-helix transcriptional regulator [Pyrinomonadaceae bacterium]